MDSRRARRAAVPCTLPRDEPSVGPEVALAPTTCLELARATLMRCIGAVVRLRSVQGTARGRSEAMSDFTRRVIFATFVVCAFGCRRLDELWANSHGGSAGADDASAVDPPAHQRLGRSSASNTAGPGSNAPANHASADASIAQAAPTSDAAVAAPAPELPSQTLTAMWIWVPIFERMDTRGRKLGYLRSGGRLRVGMQPTGTEGCARGWYAVVGPGGGYVCNNRMVSLEPDALGRRLPLQPNGDASLPYPYYISYRPAVMYRWLPSEADMRETEPERFGIVPPNATASLDGGVPASAAPGATVSQLETPTVLSTTAPVTGAGSSAPLATADPNATGRGAVAAAHVADRHEASDAGVRLEDLSGESGTPLLRRMLTGMYISVDREASSAGRRFWRTQNGGYVERGAVSLVHNAPTFQGVLLDEQHALPMAFITAVQGWTYDLSPDGRTATRRDRAPRLTAYSLTADPPVRVGRSDYHRTRDGFYVSSMHARLVRTTPPASDVGPTERWIEVNLDRQMLIAYEGSRPAYVTLVSSGRRNAAADRNYETIQGFFRVQSKHVATTMDGNSAGDGPYSIEDVPWVMYFENSFALHGAFWHNSFGYVHSHGCVNMSPPDAHWLFNWTEPALPAGWHGVYANAAQLGTRVYVHYERQALGERGGPASPPQH